MAANGAQAAVREPQVPPQNLDAEESVLGAMMLSPAAIAAISQVLSGEGREFYRLSHAKMYQAALALWRKGEPVDAITLVDELDERGDLEDIGGKVRVHELAALVPASANAGHYAQIVKEMAMLRGLIRAGDDIARLGWDREGEAPYLIARAEQIVTDLTSADIGGELVPIRQGLTEVFDHVTNLYESGSEFIGVRSGFRALDRITAGFQPGNLVILAARPAMGKSALGLAIAANATILDKITCAFFTLEMSRQEVMQRLLCSEAKVDVKALRSGRITEEDWSRLVRSGSKLETASLFIDDTAALSLLDLRARCQLLKRRQSGLGLIVVDYLQLMSAGASTESRLQEVSTISRGLKALARDLDVPVLALSQLSRAVEQRTDKRPVLSDLRESGTIEQDADLVMFLYRDEYYDDESPNQGVAELKVAKHRNGPTDDCRLAFLRSYARFSDLPN